MKKLILSILFSVGCGNLNALTGEPCIDESYIRSLYDKYKNAQKCKCRPDLIVSTIVCNKNGDSAIYYASDFIKEKLQVTYKDQKLVDIAGEDSCLEDIYPLTIPPSYFEGYCSATYENYCF